MEKCKTCKKINECEFDLSTGDCGTVVAIGKDCEIMTMVFVFKNGEKLKVKCEDCNITTNVMGNLTGYELTGITESKPLYIDMSSVQCIYKV